MTTDLERAARHTVNVWHAWTRHHATPPGGMHAAIRQLERALDELDKEGER
jgi:hypothetical protein